MHATFITFGSEQLSIQRTNGQHVLPVVCCDVPRQATGLQACSLTGAAIERK
jgi:hypothetical protein